MVACAKQHRRARLYLHSVPQRQPRCGAFPLLSRQSRPRRLTARSSATYRHALGARSTAAQNPTARALLRQVSCRPTIRPAYLPSLDRIAVQPDRAVLTGSPALSARQNPRAHTHARSLSRLHVAGAHHLQRARSSIRQILQRSP